MLTANYTHVHEITTKGGKVRFYWKEPGMYAGPLRKSRYSAACDGFRIRNGHNPRELKSACELGRKLN